MISLTISLIITAMLLIIPSFAYKNESSWALSLFCKMVETKWCKHLLAYILAGLVVAYHLSFYQTHRTDIGIYLSTAIMFATLASSKVVIALKAIRENETMRNGLAVLAVLTAFIPQCLSLAVTLAFIFELSCFYPSPTVRFQYIVNTLACNRNDFLGSYFKS